MLCNNGTIELNYTAVPTGWSAGALAPASTADYPLEIIQPRAGLDTTNRFYKAYPAIEYNVRMGVIGGIYEGFVYSLTTAPAGMTIDAATGEIVWANPTATGSPHNITAQITDGAETQTVSWTLTVTTAGFKFVDSASGSDSNDGSIGSPWQTLDKIGDAAASDFIYFRTGTYATTAHSNWDGTTESVVWLAYPSESPAFNFAAGGYFFLNVNNKLYVDGLSVNSNNNTVERAFAYPGQESNITFRRNTFEGILNGSSGNNPSYIFSTNSGTRGQYTVIQDNAATDGASPYFFLGYANSHVLVEDNAVSGLTGTGSAISPKDGNSMWFVRGNDISIANIGVNIQSYNSQGHGKGPIVIEYNNIETTGGANETLSFAGYAQDGQVVVARNTLVGRNYNYIDDAGDGPFIYRKNVIINDSDLGETDRLRMDNGTFGTVTYDDNLVGGTADGIVDANGLLTGSSRTTYLGTHGHEVQ